MRKLDVMHVALLYACTELAFVVGERCFARDEPVFAMLIAIAGGYTWSLAGIRLNQFLKR